MLQEADSIRPMLGPWGVVVSIALNAALVYITYRANLRAKTAEAWQSTATAAKEAAAAAQSEMTTWKEAAARLEREKSALSEEVGRLSAMTDLSAFREEQRESLQAIVTTQREIHAALGENTRAILSSQSQTAAAFEAVTEALRSVGRRKLDEG